MYPYATLTAVVVLASAVALPASAHAQRPVASGSRAAPAPVERCPAIVKNDFLLSEVAAVFESAGWSEARKDLKIERLPATAIKQQVTEAAVCRALYRATVQALPKVYDIKPEQAELLSVYHSLFYYRFGDYYAVLPLSNYPVRQSSDLFIFRVPGAQREYEWVERIRRALGWGDTRNELKYVGSVMM